MALKLKNSQFSNLTATPQRKTYTVTFATLSLVVILVFFAIRPAIVSIFDRRSENKTKQEVLSKMDQKYDNLISLNNQKVEQEKSLALLDSSLPESREEYFMIANLQQIVKENGVKLTSIGVEENVTKSVLDEDQITINTATAGLSLGVNGKRSSIINMIADMESFPRVINIHTINFTEVGGEQTSSDIVNASIEAEFYYYQQNAEIVD